VNEAKRMVYRSVTYLDDLQLAPLDVKAPEVHLADTGMRKNLVKRHAGDGVRVRVA